MISQGYKPVWREPVRSTYRGYSLFTMPPSSSGGVTITETMNILEGYDSLPAYGSAGWAHLLGSAYQRAFVDRNEKLADPAFVSVPIAQLTDKRYAAQLRATIGNMRATPTNDVSTAMREGMETTHYSVVDDKGQRGRDDDDAQQSVRLGRVRHVGGVLPQRRDGRLRRAAGQAEHVRARAGRRRTRSSRASGC